MLPLNAFDPTVAKNLVGVLFDLDDTLLDHGKVTACAYESLWELHEAGLKLVPVTGRPSGWAEVLTRIWPIDAMVTENGIISWLKQDDGRFELLDEVGPVERAQRHDRLMALVEDLRERYPFMKPASDVHLRRADYTFDIGETIQIAKCRVDDVETYAKIHGAMTVRSSVHLHVSFDGGNKGSGAVRTIVRGFGLDATAARVRFAFIGDSENDEPAFSTFKNSVGVKNLRGRPTVPPRYITLAERGSGFAEFAQKLLQLRS